MAVVLVVDDEFGITNLLEDVLSDEGHRVLIATNGREALDRAGEERPDVVVTDFMMPVMDGAQMLEAMAADAALRDIPVAIMSSAPEAAVRARTVHYTIYLLKPFKIFDVIDVVAELLAGRG